MKLTLKIKTLVLVTALIVIVAAILSLTHTTRQRVTLTQELERLAAALSRGLAFNSEYGVLVNDQRILDDLLEGVLQEKDVRYAALLDPRLQIVAMRGRDAGQRFQESLSRLTLAKAPSVEYVTVPGVRLCVAQHPVKLMRRQRWIEGGLVPTPETTQEEMIGTAVVALSTKPLLQHIAEVRRVTVLVTCLIVVVASVLSFILVSLLTKPLARLKAATQAVASGNLEVRLKGHSQDEVGELTSSFNRMVEEIRQARGRIEDYTRRLEATAKELANLNQEMEDMLHVVSHDLRSPLINIQGFSKRLEPIVQETLQVLEEVAANSQENGLRAKVGLFKMSVETRFAESLRFISKGVEKMDILLSSLLAISRVGRKADPIQENDLNAILDDVLATFDHQLKERGIQVIRQALPTGVPCRRNEINQVFSNLLSNAINFMGNSFERRIEIGGRELDGAVECFVKDTGIGIDPNDHERIFQMFTRLEEVEAPGEGVGLAYVRKILRAHRGTITVNSQKGQGSTFTFRLPNQGVGSHVA